MARSRKTVHLDPGDARRQPSRSVSVGAGRLVAGPSGSGFVARPFAEYDREGTVTRVFVLLKRAYDLRNGAPAVPSRAAEEIVDRDRFYRGNDPMTSALSWEADLVPPKVATDVIVRARAYSPGADAVTELTCGVEVRGYGRKDVLVIGDRAAVFPEPDRTMTYRDVRFTAPLPFKEMPLTYERAYGGPDSAAAPLEREDNEEPGAEAAGAGSDENAKPRDTAMVDEDAETLTEGSEGSKVGDAASKTEDEPGEGEEKEEEAPEPFDPTGLQTTQRYMKNPVGRGYVVKVQDRPYGYVVPLPNLEDPDDRLDPKRFEVDPLIWDEWPRPAGFDFVPRYWLPRAGLMGNPDPGIPMEELFPDGLPEGVTIEWSDPDPAYRNAAAPGLAVGPLAGSEEIICTNMHRTDSRYVVRLPGDQPVVMWEARAEGEHRADPVLGTVHIDLERERLVQVWCAELDIEGVSLPSWVGNLKVRAAGDPA